MTTGEPLNLVVLVPGKNEKATIEGLLLHRRRSLKIGSITSHILVNPLRDPGCYKNAPALLQPFQRRTEHALVIFDHEGSGQEGRTAREITQDCEERLAKSGWGERAKVVVIEPELESWVWSTSSQVDRILGWGGCTPDLRTWLKGQGLWIGTTQKPSRPKECFEAALRQVHIPRSSSIYGELAISVGLGGCLDTSFLQLRKILAEWFPIPSQGP